ncbi:MULTISPECIES: hypothetical protein [unclassified Nonomuraea]
MPAPTEQQLDAVDLATRLRAAEDLLALVDEELAEMQRGVAAIGRP